MSGIKKIAIFAVRSSGRVWIFPIWGRRSYIIFWSIDFDFDSERLGMVSINRLSDGNVCYPSREECIGRMFVLQKPAIAERSYFGAWSMIFIPSGDAGNLDVTQMIMKRTITSVFVI